MGNALLHELSCTWAGLVTRGTIFAFACVFLRMTNHFLAAVFSYRKKFASRGANSFFYELTPLKRKVEKKNGSITFPEFVSIHI